MAYTVFLVAPHRDGWQVKKQFASSPLTVYPSREAASEEATERARNNRPSKLLIHDADGTIGVRLVFDESRDGEPVGDEQLDDFADSRLVDAGIGLRRLSGGPGAELVGIDLSEPLTPDLLGGIRAALNRHKVIVARDQRLSPQEFVRFGGEFGELEVHTFFPTMAGGLENVTVLDSRGGYRSPRWHQDETFLEQPPAFSILHAQKLPSYGDDTLFIDLEMAFETLSPRMQQYLDGLEAVHDMAMPGERNVQMDSAPVESLANLMKSENRAVHPVVRRNRDTGRAGLFVNPTYTRYITGVPIEESQAILDFLYHHMNNPHFIYRHRWNVRDVLMWDNWATVHLAVDAYSSQRIMHRISVLRAFEVPVGAVGR